MTASTGVALVTGGTRGIGLATARILIERGHQVTITGRDAGGVAAALDQLGHERAWGLAGHVADAEHRRAIYAGTAERFGPPTALVNNVGVNPTYGPVTAVTETAARKIWEVNVLASLAWAAQFAEHRDQDRPGAIVQILSSAAGRPTPGIGMYGSSKAALGQLTRYLALELAPHVRCNSVIPALIDTDFSRALPTADGPDPGSRYPLGRIGRPEDVAAATAYLLSEEASWVTGTEIVVDGGLALTGGA